MLVLMWLLVLLVLTLFFNTWLEGQRNPNRSVNYYTDATGVHEVVLKRNHYGQYVATGAIQGREVVFILDTGASDVSVPSTLAGRLGLHAGPQRSYQTANGVVLGYATVLDTVSLGNIVVRDVRASINPGMDQDYVLLGMSFLRHLDFAQRGDVLTLRQYP